jgi:phospholipid/cholesterol/gamma-HCH transport system permease protein
MKPMEASRHPSFSYEFASGPHKLILRLAGCLDVNSSPSFIRTVSPLLAKQKPKGLVVDLEKLSLIDEFGVAVLEGLRAKLAEWHGNFSLQNANAEISDRLHFYHFAELKHLASERKQPTETFFESLGNGGLKFLEDQVFMITFLGSTFFSLLHVLRNPRTFRGQNTIFYMQRTGVDAVPIVASISLLMGLIMAFMSSVQLQQFGADIYVASLVSLAMTRELGPIITAIIVAGRSSSAFAAEIGSMKVSEEVEALTVMGIDPHAYLVLPKVIASLLVVPLLTLFSSVFAIIGGLIVGVTVLDITFHGYLNQTYETMTLFDIYWGVFKGAVFALLISWTGCLRGFQVRGGATAVGQAATSAVVTSIFIIILVDSIFAVLLTYWAPERMTFAVY